MKVADHRLSRRQALGTGLVGAGALAALISGCGTSSTAAADSTTNGLEGAWRLDVTTDNGQQHQGLVMFTRDGGVGISATLAPNSFANGFGAWSQSGGKYLITFQALVVTGGAFDGSLKISATPTIDHTGDQLTARATFDVQPAGASTFTSGGSATWTGSRIKPAAL
jgi:hypothetical protein